MKKYFFIFFIIYLIPAIAGNRGWQYFEYRKETQLLYEYWYIVLLIGLIAFGIFYILARKSFPVFSDARYKKFFAIATVVFLFFILIITATYIKFINNYIGTSNKMIITGTVTGKSKMFKKKKEDKRLIEITEDVTGKKYVFRVRSATYLLIKEGEPFSKDFQQGSLGILFRNEK